MSRILTDSEIGELVKKPKRLPKGWRSRLRLVQRADGAQKRRALELKENKDLFIINCRQSALNPFDFSIILLYRDEKGNKFRLLRCNGKHPSWHSNRWEKGQGLADYKFAPCFHIHRATQRCQEADMDIDGYAEPTGAYSNYDAALEHFVTICGCIDPEPLGTTTPDLLGGAI
jgi:hypothetical protein